MWFNLNEMALWDMRKQAAIQKINQSGLPLVLFGKAPAANSNFLQQLQVPVPFICDNDPAKWGTKLWGLEIVRPDQLQKLGAAYNVLILVPFEKQIIPQLQALPAPPAEIFRLDLYFEENSGCFQSAQSEMEQVYRCLADQMSKDTFEAVIRYRMNRNPEYLAKIALPRKTQYFPETLGGKRFLEDHEIFADAGAFIGDTVESFYTAVQGRYHSIYAFEPEKANYQKLLENAAQYSDVSCQRIAVGDTKGTVCFSADDSSSRAADKGELIPVDTLDHLLDGVPVTYLKMDVEGMECAALQGAKKLIQTYRPKLAICTYHSDADMVQVPKLILELCPSYKLYFRHYTHALVETVCYAI